MKALSFFLVMFFFVTTSLYAKSYKVAMFYPRDAPFWKTYINFMHEAANDLKIEFQSYAAKDNQFTMRRQLTRVVTGPDRVDAVVFNNFRHTAPALIKIAEEAKVVAFLVNSALGEDYIKTMGIPREKYKYWIGEMLPDEKAAGVTMTNLLVGTAISKNKINNDGKVHVVGINGPIAAGASIMRHKALKKAVENRSDVKIIRVVHSDQWSESVAKTKFIALRKRYPDIFVFWAGSNRLVNGIIEGAHQLGLVPGRDFVTGGPGISNTMLKRVKSGEVVVNTGGHFIEGAWAMVILYDYFHGIDFAQKDSVQLRTPMAIVTQDNVDLYLDNFREEKMSKENLKKIDFTRYSKQLNPLLKEYKFNLDSVLSRL